MDVRYVVAATGDVDPHPQQAIRAGVLEHLVGRRPTGLGSVRLAVAPDEQQV
jgi:hypothetical protein